MTNILTVAVDSELVERIAAIPGHRLMTIGRENFRLVQPDETFLPDLILVGDGLNSEQAIRYGRRVLADYPMVSVVLVSEPNRELIREATRAGIRGVIRSTLNDRELAGLIKRAGASSAAAAAPGGRHQVIVVASPKGGVGKTTVAVNLAALLAEQAPGEVVLIDLDIQFGDVSTVLDLDPKYTLADALNSSASDSMLLRTLLVAHPANFHVLCGADHPAAAGRFTGDQIRKLVSQFSHDYRYVVVDTSAGLQEETLASLEEATDVAFVATLDVATLRNVRKEVDVLAELGLLPECQHLVLNRTDRLSGLTQRDAESIVSLPVEALVPVSANVPLAANHGQLAVHVKKKNKVRRPLRQFARAVSDHSRTVVNHEQPRAAKSSRPGRHR
jgi:pilus assembly protein CpaE